MPSLPAHWKSLSFRFQIQGQAISLRITDREIQIASDAVNSQAVWFEAAGRPATQCAPGESLVWDA
jgi:trehalose/maltose hydrolase-like predicted phosphorylase